MSDLHCRICGNEYSKRGMSQHLRSCISKHGANGRAGIHIKVETPWKSPFCLHLVVDTDATLADLDRFLRTIWLECCGHLSEFEIAGTHYDVSGGGDFGPPAETMNFRVSRVLPDGREFSYTYDFGSYTRLEGRSYGEVVWPEELEVDSDESTDRILLVVRNEQPDLPCDVCGEPAKWVCNQCPWHADSAFCVEHAVDHEHSHEMMLPVVNSPRMGVCGYTGSQWDDVDFAALQDAYIERTSPN